MKILVLVFLTSPALAAEIDYSKAWCLEHGGKAEVVFPDRSRADCVTETHAVEVEWAAKWKHAVGQSLTYAMLSSKKAGIVLIMGPDDDKYLLSLKQLLETTCLPIDVWTVPR